MRKCERCGFMNLPKGKRVDAFGIGDIIGCHREHGIALFQAASSASASHIRKIVGECYESAEDWLRSGGLIYVLSWRKVKREIFRKDTGTSMGKREVWRPLTVEIYMAGEDIVWSKKEVPGGEREEAA